MNTKDLIHLGIPPGEAARRAIDFIANFILGGGDKSRLTEELTAILKDPARFQDDALRAGLAKSPPRGAASRFDPLPPISTSGAPGWTRRPSCKWKWPARFPWLLAGALMPDAHVGYGLPIGGVLATDNAVIPYAVGVDIACRMKMSVLDLPIRDLNHRPDRLARAIETETRFGVGASFKNRRSHEVMDADWAACPVTKQQKTAPGRNWAPAAAAIILSNSASSPRMSRSATSSPEPTSLC